MERAFNVVYADLNDYQVNRYAPCGYSSDSVPDLIHKTLEEALLSPGCDGDVMYQRYNDEDFEVASFSDGEWILHPNCDSRKVAEFELDAELFDRIPSLNAEYTVKKSKKFAQKTLTTYGRKFKEWIKGHSLRGDNELLGYVEGLDSVKWKSQNTGSFRYYFQIDFIFYIKPDKVFHRRDTSNMIKLPEDALSDCWGINDARHVRLGLCEKRESPRGEVGNEIVQVRIQLLRTSRI